ncbi:MAG: hypothetical protein JXB85_09495 [Anaerolineales bacterium]|nr:hypothetical protein [Anaerolineales bacterium]
MNRRAFLKLAAIGSLAILTARFTRTFSSLSPGAPSPGDSAVRLGKKVFKGVDSLVLVSADEGLTWRRSANFGGEARVKDLSVSGGRMFARTVIPGGRFDLVSVDGVVWRTVG